MGPFLLDQHPFNVTVKLREMSCFAEEAVNEVKRQAMTELQKAVSEAERKAHDMITTERAKMERTVAEAKRQATEDALAVINQQEDSSEVSPSPAEKVNSRFTPSMSLSGAHCPMFEFPFQSVFSSPRVYFHVSLH